jgi:hypothetical protein
MHLKMEHPIMRKMIEVLGKVPGLLVPKAIFAGLLICFYQQVTFEAFVLVSVIYSAVIINNVRIALNKG